MKLENDLNAALADKSRLDWLLENHVANFECVENIAGNFDRYHIPATREAIDMEISRANGTTPSDVTACSGFARPAQETWRWYAWTRMKRSEPLRWVPTVWKADTEEEAQEKRDRAIEEDDTIILVHEVTNYIPNQ